MVNVVCVIKIILLSSNIFTHIPISHLLSKERVCVWRFSRFSFAWFLGAAWSFVLLLKTSLGISCNGHNPGQPLSSLIHTLHVIGSICLRINGLRFVFYWFGMHMTLINDKANITGSKALLQSIPVRARDTVYVLLCLYECDHSSVCLCVVRNSQRMCFAVVCGGHCIVIHNRSA